MENQGTTLSEKKPPQPDRFKEYDEAEDGSGFFLPDGTFFEFDKFGGWFDEFGNYYNKDGVPSMPPQVDIFHQER